MYSLIEIKNRIYINFTYFRKIFQEDITNINTFFQLLIIHFLVVLIHETYTDFCNCQFS